MIALPVRVAIRATDTPDNPGDEKRALIVDRRGVRIAEICLHGSADVDNARADTIAMRINDPKGAFIASVEAEIADDDTQPERREWLRRILPNVRKI